MVRENSSLQHFRQTWFCMRSEKFLLLKKGEGKESETALAAGSPLPWLMFAREQGDISGAQRIINCPCQDLWPQGHRAMVHWKTTGVRQNKSGGAGGTRALRPWKAELCTHPARCCSQVCSWDSSSLMLTQHKDVNVGSPQSCFFNFF